MSDQTPTPTPTPAQPSEAEVPHIDSKEELAGFVIKNDTKVMRLILALVLSVLLLFGGILFLVKISGEKVSTPIGTIENNRAEVKK